MQRSQCQGIVYERAIRRNLDRKTAISIIYIHKSYKIQSSKTKPFKIYQDFITNTASEQQKLQQVGTEHK